MLQTVLIVIGTVIGTLTLLGGGAYLWGRSKIASVRAALSSMHADLGAGAAWSGGGAPAGGSYQTLSDEDLDQLERVVKENSGPLKPSLPVLQNCSGCASFSLTMGQKQLQAAPAFLMATQWLQPWQMAQKRNPEWIAAETELHEAKQEAKAGARAQPALTPAHLADLDAKVAELTKKLASINEYLPMEKREEMMKLSIEDFGLCVSHGELRAKIDRCDRWKSDRATEVSA